MAGARNRKAPVFSGSFTRYVRRLLWIGVLALFSVWTGAEELTEARDCIAVPEQADSDSFRFLPSPTHDELAGNIPPGAVIRSIRIKRFKVFDLTDPKEDRWLYRWANDFHSVTRESVVRNHLLVEEGEHYNLPRLKESERILRDLRFIYDASVRPWRWCGEFVDLEVITRDIWTFIPMISFTRSGGANDYGIGFRDTNLLGSGKQVMIRHESDEERSGNTLVYADPMLLGTRWRLRLSLTDNDDGYDRGLRLARPFFSIYESWSAGGALEQQLLEDKVWFRGDEVAEFEHQRDQVKLFGGIASDTTPGRQVGRWRFGYNYETHDFDYSDSDIPPPELPDDRDYSYPYLGYQSIEDEFTTVTNLDYLGRTEDLYVGEHYEWSLGWSDESLGATRDQLVFQGSYGNTLRLSPRDWWVLNSWISGFWAVDDEEFENLWATIESRYHVRQAEKWTLFARLRLDYTDGLTLDNQLTLGGSNGLRGYDRHYQTGDRAFVFNLEQRYYSDWHPFRLVRVGAAAFLDVGRAWFEDRDNGPNGGVLANVGFGLRFNSSRAEKSSVIHIDLAYPLVKEDDVDIDNTQFLITVKDSF
jgi:outer membrane protein assembly factor BamA